LMPSFYVDDIVLSMMSFCFIIKIMRRQSEHWKGYACALHRRLPDLIRET
jgi:hypothetical protein